MTPALSLVKPPTAANARKIARKIRANADEEDQVSSHLHLDGLFIQKMPTASSTAMPTSITQPSGSVNIGVEVVGLVSAGRA